MPETHRHDKKQARSKYEVFKTLRVQKSEFHFKKHKNNYNIFNEIRTYN